MNEEEESFLNKTDLTDKVNMLKDFFKLNGINPPTSLGIMIVLSSQIISVLPLDSQNVIFTSFKEQISLCRAYRKEKAGKKE